TTSTSTSTSTSTTTSTIPAVGVTLYGDADLDGEVKMNDVIRIMCHASNKEAYPLDAQAMANCDVYQRGDGIDLSDALSIQKRVAQVITSLPESVM
nr:hypothetical protein [Ruminococcus sp.]